MAKTLIVFSVLMSVLLITSLFGNFVFAQNTKIKTISKNDEKKNTSDKAKAFADVLRKKILEKYHNDYKSKKEDSKKQIALDAKKKLDSKKLSK